MTAIVLDVSVLLWLFAMIVYLPLWRKFRRAKDRVQSPPNHQLS
jgi:hypothetical protein